MSMAEAKKLGGELVAFLHYPPVYDSMECQEILDLLAENQITRCYFGHIHGQYAPKKPWLGSIKGCICALFPQTMFNSVRSWWNRALKFFAFSRSFCGKAVDSSHRVCYNYSVTSVSLF